MVDYQEYLDETNGINPSIGADSFNNIVYSTELVLGKTLQGTITEEDLELYKSHIKLNEDPHGLYVPKNSHDNITSKMMGSLFLGLDLHEKMDFFNAIKGANFHPRDVILYGFTLLEGLPKRICGAFLWLVGLIMIQSCVKKYKVRPKLRDRIKFILDRKKKKIQEYPTFTGYGRVENWKMSDGSTFQLNYYQNDGKILTVIRLLALSDESIQLKITAKICAYLLKLRYGDDYMYNMLREYFQTNDHPSIEAWKNVENIL